MTRVTAPYNFVPVNAEIFSPDWAPAVAQDFPFQDGICGTLDLEIVAQGPIFVRGKGEKRGEQNHLDFFTTPDGRPAIAGSSLRGMLRNVLQIASFGKFAPVNDHRYGVRDLHNRKLYLDEMATLVPGQKGAAGVAPLVSAGWLTRKEGAADGAETYEIQPCSFAKIEYGYLQTLQPAFKPGRKQSAVEKYGAWRGTREVRVALGPSLAQRERASRCIGGYHIVAGLDGTRAGTLVFTGQPSEWDPQRHAARKGAGKPKHHDFVFLEEVGEPLPVEPARFRDFEFIHSDRGQQSRNTPAPNVEWSYWSDQLAAGRPVPVFFLLEPGGQKLRSFGLAMMFRLAYRHSIGEIADANQWPTSAGGDLAPRRDPNALDLAETIFGTVPLDGSEASIDGGRALKGRVSIGLAMSENGKQLPDEVVAVLGAPKASYYPNYVEQAVRDPQLEPGAQAVVANGHVTYRTYQDADARLRGYKRYRPQDAILKPELPAKSSDRVKSWFRPLDKGAVFASTIRLHNLRPEELGALLWAIDFGGAKEAEHMLGMARSFGFGRVKLRVRSASLQLNDGAAEDASALQARCRNGYASMMEQFARSKDVPGGWRDSVQLHALLACARPLPHGSTDGRHLSLADARDGNQFVAAKKAGAALPPASEWDPPVDSESTAVRRAGQRGAPSAASEPARSGQAGTLARPVVPAAPPGPFKAVVVRLRYEPGPAVWSGEGKLDGKTVKISFRGKGLPNATAKEHEKREVKAGVECLLGPAGGGTFSVLELVR